MSYDIEDSHLSSLRHLPNKRISQSSTHYICDLTTKKSTENGLILSIDSYHFFMVKMAKKKAEILVECYFLNIQKIFATEENANQLVIETKQYGALSLVTPSAANIIHSLRQRIFGDLFIDFKEDSDIIKVDIPESLRKPITKVDRLCDNFRGIYIYFCHYNNVLARDNIIYTFERLWGCNQLDTFDLDEFDAPLSVLDMKALFGALCYSTYFKNLKITHSKLEREAVTAFFDCMRLNSKIEKLELSDLQVNKDFFVELFREMQLNQSMALHILNMSNNREFGDYGAQALSQWLSHLGYGCSIIELASCYIKGRSISILSNTFRKNEAMFTSLTTLDLSYNRLEPDGGTSGLAGFLAQPNCISVLKLRDTGMNVQTLFSALTRGTCRDLRDLDISYNKINCQIDDIALFIRGSTTIRNLCMDAMSIPRSLLKKILIALYTNPFLTKISLSLANNGFGVPEARVISNEALNFNNIVKVDLSDNEFEDEGICLLMQGIENSSILHLDISRTISTKTSQIRDLAIQAIIKLLSSTQIALRSFVFKGSKSFQLGSDMVKIFLSVSKSPIEYLDVSGHGFGNRGTSALAKFIQNNTTLARVVWDQNGTSLTGFRSFCKILENNTSIQHIEVPILDLDGCLNRESERVGAISVIREIEALLIKNNAPAQRDVPKDIKQTTSKLYMNIHQRDVLERSTLKLRGFVSRLNDDEKIAVEDASNFENMVHSFQDSRFAHLKDVKQSIRDKLEKDTPNLKPLIDENITLFRSELMDIVRKHIIGLDEDILQRMITGIQYGTKEISEKEINEILVERVVSELLNHTNQNFISAIDMATDYCFEKVDESLQLITERLKNHFKRESISHSGVASASRRGENNDSNLSSTTSASMLNFPEQVSSLDLSTAKISPKQSRISGHGNSGFIKDFFGGSAKERKEKISKKSKDKLKYIPDPSSDPSYVSSVVESDNQCKVVHDPRSCRADVTNNRRPPTRRPQRAEA